ncbi:hypothetical protein COBT_002782 [Conglomerata obtusa]
MKSLMRVVPFMHIIMCAVLKDTSNKTHERFLLDETILGNKDDFYANTNQAANGDEYVIKLSVNQETYNLLDKLSKQNKTDINTQLTSLIFLYRLTNEGTVDGTINQFSTSKKNRDITNDELHQDQTDGLNTTINARSIKATQKENTRISCSANLQKECALLSRNEPIGLSGTNSYACYFNTFIQVIFNMDVFMRNIVKLPSEFDETIEIIKKFFYEYITHKSLNPINKDCAMNAFIESLSDDDAKNFKDDAQADAKELLFVFLNIIYNLNPNKKTIENENNVSFSQLFTKDDYSKQKTQQKDCIQSIKKIIKNLFTIRYDNIDAKSNKTYENEVCLLYPPQTNEVIYYLEQMLNDLFCTNLGTHINNQNKQYNDIKCYPHYLLIETNRFNRVENIKNIIDYPLAVSPVLNFQTTVYCFCAAMCYMEFPGALDNQNKQLSHYFCVLYKNRKYYLIDDDKVLVLNELDAMIIASKYGVQYTYDLKV